jgi:hypothetical protein
MTGPDHATENRLRTMFLDAAPDIHPSRPAPGAGAARSRARRASVSRLSLGLAVCVAVAAVAALGVHVWGGSGGSRSLSGGGAAGDLLTIRSDGSVDLASPATGTVLRTLVGPSPVDSSGRRLHDPFAVTASESDAYIAYGRPRSTIESVPLAGGALTYVTDGMDPAVSPDGSMLAYFRLFRTSDTTGRTVTGAVVVRNLASGSEKTVDSTAGFTIVQELSWSSDDTELAISGVFDSGAGASLVTDTRLGVQVLSLDEPTSGTNPRFVGSPTSLSAQTAVWSDGQFPGTGTDLAAIVNSPGSACQPGTTTVLSVDPTTGQTTPVASLPFRVLHVIFDQAGALVAFERVSLPPDACRVPAPTTTTTSGAISRLGSSISGSAIVVADRYVLYRWANGASRQLATDIVAATIVYPTS